MPNSNLFTHRLLFFLREATSETSTAPGLLSHIQKYLAAIYLLRDLFIQSFTTFSRQHAISGTVPRKGLTTPLTRRVARSCSLCAGAVYVVLLGSPTGSITLVSSPREIPTVAVLHHPFLFREIPT